MPNESVMARAKVNSRIPLRNATTRVNKPRMRAKPNTISAAVAVQATIESLRQKP